MDDKHRLHAAAVGLIVSALMSGFAMVALIFSDPPPKRHQILRAWAEKALTVAAVTFGAPICAPWAADAVNGAISLLPMKLGFKVDQLTAVALLASLSVVLIANPDARARLRAWLRGRNAEAVQ